MLLMRTCTRTGLHARWTGFRAAHKLEVAGTQSRLRCSYVWDVTAGSKLGVPWMRSECGGITSIGRVLPARPASATFRPQQGCHPCNRCYWSVLSSHLLINSRVFETADHSVF